MRTFDSAFIFESLKVRYVQLKRERDKGRLAFENPESFVSEKRLRSLDVPGGRGDPNRRRNAGLRRDLETDAHRLPRMLLPFQVER